MDDPQFVLMTGTCHNGGCENNGVPCQVWSVPDAAWVCGACGGEITDVEISSPGTLAE